MLFAVVIVLGAVFYIKEGMMGIADGMILLVGAAATAVSVWGSLRFGKQAMVNLTDVEWQASYRAILIAGFTLGFLIGWHAG